MIGIDLSSKVALITGSRRGIGRETALLLAEAGADIVLNDMVRDDVFEAVKKQIEDMGRKAVILEGDITDRARVEEICKSVKSTFGGVDILVNNAGIALSNTMANISLDDWNKVIDVNLTGIFNFCQLISPMMVDRKFGRIINISSIAGRRGSLFGDVHYSAAKAGVIGFTKCLARIVAPHNVTVNAIAPGIAMTEILSEEHHKASLANIPMGRAANAKEIASVILFFASELSSYVTGVVLDVNGGSYM